MIENLIIFLQTNILPLGSLGVFLASVIEEVVAPIPSALIMIMSGFLFVNGGFSLNSIFALVFKVALPAALGVTLGSLLVFFVAKIGGKFLIEKWGRYIGLFWSDIEKIKNHFSGTKKDEILIILARTVPFVPSVAISAFCGLMQMTFVKYFTISFVGTFFRGLILGLVGWQVGNLYFKYAQFLSSIEKQVFLSTIIILIIFLVIKYKRR